MILRIFYTEYEKQSLALLFIIQIILRTSLLPVIRPFAEHD